MTWSWGDEVDDEAEEQSAAPTMSADKVGAELDVYSLTIDESKKINKFLHEPEDPNVEAVTYGPYTSASTFEDLNLSPELLKGLYVEMRFTKPSKIQAIILPMILTPPYRNLIAQARYGSGKTTCLVFGMLSRVDPNMKAPQALCICSTRELAIQNLEVLQKMGKYTGVLAEAVVPMVSTNYIPIPKRAPVTAQIVIGTPVTTNKWIAAKKLGTRYIKILVFDEADHMLAQDSFGDECLRITKHIERSNASYQVLLFSATFNDKVKNFVRRIAEDYNQLFVRKEELSSESVKQYKVNCPNELCKASVIRDSILELGENVRQTIIFVRAKHSAKLLHETLVKFGYEVTTLQGVLRQEDRDKMVKEFKDGLTGVLISTDLPVRGLVQPQVNLVINYDLPVNFDNPSEPDYEAYSYRIGRAGSFGRKGAVFNLLCSERDMALMAKIENNFASRVAEVTPWDSEEEFQKALQAAGLL